MELEALQQAVGPITDLGATLVAVSPQIETLNREFIQKHRLTFDILSDPGNEVAKTFGLVHEVPDDLRKVYLSFGIDLEKSNADGLWHLPMAARYIIDQNSVVRSADVNADYTVRPEPNETVEFLRKMIEPS